jgi:glycosyltransferase involved in cell wall biosynthesis
MSSPRVLIDGYNLSMRQGTGIKTYTGLLQDALTSLGAETTLLFGRPIPKSDDPILREIAFYDDDRPRSMFDRIRREFDVRAAALFGNAPKIQDVPQGGVVVLPEEGQLTCEAMNGSRLYDIAFKRSEMAGKSLSVKLPRDFDAIHLTFPIPARFTNSAAKKIVTIHDVIPLRLPYTTLDDKVEVLRRHRDAVAGADLVFTVSEHSKKDIVSYLDVDPEKIAVTYQPSRFKPLKGPELRDRAKSLRRRGLSAGEYMLFVGAIEPKKNLGRFVKAYVEADVDTPLVIAGPRAWMWKEEVGWAIESTDPNIQRKVRFLNHVTSEELRFLVSGAMALSFPSLYEGYGLPPVEAMSFGVPVLTSRVSSMPEVCGDAALYIDPYDPRDMREKIERLVGDKALRDYLTERALRRTEQLTPAAFAEQVAAGYRRIGLLD